MTSTASPLNAPSRPLRILLLGPNGQVGHALLPVLSAMGDLRSVSRDEADLSQPERLADFLQGVEADVIVNAAAYTAVDKAEADVATAWQVNAHAVRLLAAHAARCGALLLHYSTDYVFDGRKASPYAEGDPTAPMSVYGASKRTGEVAIESAIVDQGCRALVLRTSWVFSAHGGNFVKTILRLAREREVLRIVADQIGAPTGANLIARVSGQAIRALLAGRLSSGIYHLTASGATSWHGLATHVLRTAADKGMQLRASPDAIEPIPSKDYPVPAPRPMNSRLDTTRLTQALGITLPDWREEVTETVGQLCSSPITEPNLRQQSK